MDMPERGWKDVNPRYQAEKVLVRAEAANALHSAEAFVVFTHDGVGMGYCSMIGDPSLLRALVRKILEEYMEMERSLNEDDDWKEAD